MVQKAIETFSIKTCPLCKGRHFVKVNVFRNILPNDLNKDVRVPEFKKVPVNLRCPVKGGVFSMDLYIQEDVFSKIVKLQKPGL